MSISPARHEFSMPKQPHPGRHSLLVGGEQADQPMASSAVTRWVQYMQLGIVYAQYKAHIPAYVTSASLGQVVRGNITQGLREGT